MIRIELLQWLDFKQLLKFLGASKRILTLIGNEEGELIHLEYWLRNIHKIENEVIERYPKVKY
jgi:hypothetical protein